LLDGDTPLPFCFFKIFKTGQLLGIDLQNIESEEFIGKILQTRWLQ
jgi:hypothetical protein